MSNLKKIYFIILLNFFLVGCSQNSINKSQNSPKKQVSTVKKENVVKKSKPKIVYEYCNNHRKTMNHALNYIVKEFENGYFNQNDIVGAKAQLFLIESNSPTIFAKNINAAQKSYVNNYQIAKKNGCNLTEFNISALNKIKDKIKILEENLKKEELIEDKK